MISGNEIKILIVDDEEDICDILKFNLESEGYQVDAVNSSEEALKKKLEKYQELNWISKGKGCLLMA